MPYTTDVSYLYDGTFDGFLCCVYESMYEGEAPFEIVREDEAQPTLFVQKTIMTDSEKAARVYASITTKINARAEELVRNVFLSCVRERERMILRFLLMGYKRGAQTTFLLSHPAVAPMLAAERGLLGEAHLLKGFIRFSDVGNALVTTITPKNFVLPYLAPHFCTRFMCEDFLIFDKTHKAALVYREHHAEVVALERLIMPPANEVELQYRALWKRFYDTISIAARENSRCRSTHMPKRYWANMTEFQLADTPTSAKFPAERSIAANELSDEAISSSISLQ